MSYTHTVESNKLASTIGQDYFDVRYYRSLQHVMFIFIESITNVCHLHSVHDGWDRWPFGGLRSFMKNWIRRTWPWIILSMVAWLTEMLSNKWPGENICNLHEKSINETCLFKKNTNKKWEILRADFIV